jgi:hypothetical protein
VKRRTMARSTSLVFGLAISCALIVLLAFRTQTQRSTLESVPVKHPSDFQQVWNDWLGRVNREVKAAVDISAGLSPEKKESLNGLLSKDLVFNFSFVAESIEK